MAAAARADWQSICRRAGAAAQAALEPLRTTAQRSRQIGRGEGGDMTLAIDSAAEDAIVAELEASGVPLMLVSEERGEQPLSGGGPTYVVVDPIDGSLNAKRGLGPYGVSIAVAEGDTMGDVVFGYVLELAAGEEFTARRGEGARLDGVPLPPLASDAPLEVLGVESARPDLVAGAAVALANSGASRLRMPGSMALALCYVAAGRYDAMLTLRSARSVDVAAAQLVAREAGAVVAFPDAAGGSLSAGLGLDMRSRCLAAATPELLDCVIGVSDQVEG
jgi:myo-inositol-1(or 4)-monophosphatase